MVKGDFDLYPEYTGTSWSFVLKEKELPDDATLFKELNQQYQKNYHMEWVGLYGFNNTYGIAVTKKLADLSLIHILHKMGGKIYAQIKDDDMAFTLVFSY